MTSICSVVNIGVLLLALRTQGVDGRHQAEPAREGRRPAAYAEGDAVGDVLREPQLKPDGDRVLVHGRELAACACPAHRGTPQTSPPRFCVRLGQRARELAPRADPELAVRVAQVDLDRL